MAVKANADVRAYAIEKGVPLWKLAHHLGYSHENSFSRRLRYELPEDVKQEYKTAIDVIADDAEE